MKNKKEIIEIINIIDQKITNETDINWTKYNSIKELKKYLIDSIEEIENDNEVALNSIKIDFLPTSTFQEISITNGWTKVYILLAEKFDKLI